MEEAYLIIKTGPEGIDALCYLSDNVEDVLKQRKQIIEEAIKERRRKEREYKLSRKASKQEITNYYCVQKWDGEKFSCCCKELGVAPSQLMLR